jgi:acyl carrier protein
MDTRDVIRRYLIEHAVTPGLTTFDEKQSLLDQGVLDSFGLVNLVEFLEQRFGLQVADDEIDAAEFSLFDRLCDFVERRQAPRGGGRPPQGVGE